MLVGGLLKMTKDESNRDVDIYSEYINSFLEIGLGLLIDEEKQVPWEDIFGIPV